MTLPQQGRWTPLRARRVRDTPPAVQGELLSVQRLRGVAVLMVLIVHIEDIAQRMNGWADFHSAYSRIVGYSAPDLFFVISGFIMSYITLSTPFQARRWLVSRTVRIYPMYLLFTLASVALWWHNPAMTMGSGEHDGASVVKSLLMLPQAELPLLFVGWTIEHEVVFYAVVFLTSVSLGREHLFKVLLALSGFALVRQLTQHALGTEWWDWHLGSPYMLQFTLGAWVFWGLPTLRRLGWVWPLAMFVLAMAGGARWAHSTAINHESLPRVLWFGLAYSSLLLAALNHEHGRRLAGTLPPHRDVLVRVGDASYSIYLSHPFVLASLGKVLPWLDPQGLGQWLCVVLLGAAVLGVGHLVHEALEKPVMAWGKRLNRHRLLNPGATALNRSGKTP